MELSITDSYQNSLHRVQKTIEHIKTSISTGECNNCIYCKYLGILNQDIANLIYNIKPILPIEADRLMKFLPGLTGVNKVNAFDFGGIMATISIIDSHFKSGIDFKIINRNVDSLNIIPVKIFISHSSKDICIIEAFIKYILRLGCGLQLVDILCSSLEPTGIKTGKDIRVYLQQQLQSCDYVFFMISDNYLKSSICLNEMGGAWALNKEVKPFLFPQSNFSDMGWLYEISKGAKLDNEEALDELRDELLDKYNLIERPKTSDWTTQKRSFFACFQSKGI